ELVALTHEDAIDLELDAIGEIRLNQRGAVGFKKLHLRARIPAPIPPRTLRLEDLGEPSRSGLMFRGSNRRIADSFIVRLGASSWLYGIAEAGEVRILGLAVDGALEDEALATLERLQKERALLFVDWCGCRTGMRAFFEG